MAFGLSRARYSPIGIDLGADSLKLLQLRLDEPAELVAAACAPIPEAVREDNVTREAFLAEKLRELLRTAPFRGRRVSCAIPAFQTLMHLLEFPRVEREGLELQVQLQLQERLNVDPERMVVRNVPVAEVQRDGKSLQEVLCMAAPREAVMRYLGMMSLAKLEVVGLHAEPTALVKGFSHATGGMGAAGTVAYVDIGAATTKVVIAHGDEVVFAKTIQAAGDAMTRAHAASTGLDFDAARLARWSDANGAAAEKSPAGLAAAASDSSASAAAAASGGGGGTGLAALDAQMGVEPGDEAAEPVEGPVSSSSGIERDADTVETLVDEIQLCLRYHRRMFPDRAVDKLVFCGGEARHRDLCQRVARGVGVAAELGDPLALVSGRTDATRYVGVDLSRIEPGWAVAYGLCL